MHHQHHAQGGDERGHAQLGHDEAVDEAGDDAGQHRQDDGDDEQLLRHVRVEEPQVVRRLEHGRRDHRSEPDHAPGGQVRAGGHDREEGPQRHDGAGGRLHQHVAQGADRQELRLELGDHDHQQDQGREDGVVGDEAERAPEQVVDPGRSRRRRRPGRGRGGVERVDGHGGVLSSAT
ncbi:MAG: hypothetical protein QM767_20315 [Anaeromyxobacter sp.]